MNPFNSEKLTAEQLDHDCLCYLSITKEPVKSSRLFMGHLHDVAVMKLNEHFNKDCDYYKGVKTDTRLIHLCQENRVKGRIYFDNDPFSREVKEKIDFFAFKSFEEGYHRLMVELSELAVKAINLVIPADNDIENIYLTGGFLKNPIFIKLISEAYSMKNVYTSEIFNATALGAALIIFESLNPGKMPSLNLGLNQC